MSSWNEQVIEEFRANSGIVGGNFKGMTLLLLHTIGAKSGQPRLNPLATIVDDGRYIIIASKGGAPSHPDWYYNLVANPEVCVEVGTEKFNVRAEIVSEPERTDLYAKVAEVYPRFAEYEQRTDRVIPVIALTPIP